eukprot:TRINITY_DN8646_c0_g1_i2.p1 TRINITY_DN8646_c0_g1~~TRINITY_DN8646_c0_g1_i2.p1  ORF type:complete len:814 (-),score=177.24 TRINITY_DN8646_c0_g1_i2:161-2602(-)
MAVPSCWPVDELKKCVNGNRWDSDREAFRALRKAILSSDEEDLEELSAHAVLTWTFLLEFCIRHGTYKRLVLECISVLVACGPWQSALKANAELVAKVGTLPTDVQGLLQQKRELLQRSLSAELDRPCLPPRVSDLPLEGAKIGGGADAAPQSPVDATPPAHSSPSSASTSPSAKTDPKPAAKGSPGVKTPGTSQPKAAPIVASEEAAAQLRDGIKAVLEIKTASQWENGSSDAFNKLRTGCLRTAGATSTLHAESANAQAVLTFLVDFAKKYKMQARRVNEVASRLVAAEAWAEAVRQSEALVQRIEKELPADTKAAFGLASETASPQKSIGSPSSPAASTPVTGRSDTSSAPASLPRITSEEAKALQQSPTFLPAKASEEAASSPSSQAAAEVSAASSKAVSGSSELSSASPSDGSPAAASVSSGRGSDSAASPTAASKALEPPLLARDPSGVAGGYPDSPAEAQKIITPMPPPPVVKGGRHRLQFRPSIQLRAIDKESDLVPVDLENRAKEAVKAANDAASKTTVAAEWREAATPDGRKYYYHFTTRESRWDKPKDVPPPVMKAGTLSIGDFLQVWSESRAVWCEGIVEKFSQEATAVLLYRWPSAAGSDLVRKELPVAHEHIRTSSSKPSSATPSPEAAPAAGQGTTIPASGTGCGVASIAGTTAAASSTAHTAAGARERSSSTSAWSAGELEAYAAYFQRAGGSRCGPAEGKVEVADAARFLASSGLPRPALKEVWELASQSSHKDSQQSWNVAQFWMACRLIGHCGAMQSDPRYGATIAQGGPPLKALLKDKCTHSAPSQIPTFSGS